MNSQMTRLALGGKCGLPSGGCQPDGAARTMPSALRIAPSESPVKPIPRSARKLRRDNGWKVGCVIKYFPSSDGHEIIVVEQDVNEAFSGPCAGGRRYLERREQIRLPLQESLADRLFFR